MIEINFNDNTYTCPYCGREQTFSENNMDKSLCAYHSMFSREHRESNGIVYYDIFLYHIECSNKSCKKIIVVGYNKQRNRQWDLIPENVYKDFPDYIPQQIREDYKEASLILNISPKAAATLLRRCLQGMIHDFWGIHEKNLNAEITTLKSKVNPFQWKAIDGLRSMGNIGAHMEHDVNLIIDIDTGETEKLQQLIELLLDKWYINRHEEEELYKSISQTAENKETQRNG